MSDTIAQNWWLIVIVLILGIFIGWGLWRAIRANQGVPEVETRDEPEQPAQAADIGTAGHPLGAHDSTRREDVPVGNAAHPIADTVANPVPGPAATTAPAPLPEAEATLPGRPNIAAAGGAPDNLRQIKGIGPRLDTLLGELGVTRFDQIAAWSDADAAEVDRFLGNFAGRIERDHWRDQAGYLARGDIAGFEAKYGKL